MHGVAAPWLEAPLALPSQVGAAGAAAAAASPFQCDICAKGFQIRDSLYKHRSVHRGATTCPICQAVLNRKGYLRRHLATVHGADSVASATSAASAPTTCPICRVGLRASQLRRHLASAHQR